MVCVPVDMGLPHANERDKNVIKLAFLTPARVIKGIYLPYLNELKIPNFFEKKVQNNSSLYP